MSLTIEVKFSDVPKPVTYTISWSPDLTIQKAMQLCFDKYDTPHAQHPFTFWIQYYGTYNTIYIGYMPIEINGKRRVDNYVWFVYLNGRKTKNSLDASTLNPDDKIEFKYETIGSAEEENAIYTAMLEADKALTI